MMVIGKGLMMERRILTATTVLVVVMALGGCTGPTAPQAPVEVTGDKEVALPASPPRKTNKPGMMKHWDIGVSLAMVTGAEPSATGNAGDDYNSAVKAKDADKDRIRRITEVADHAARDTVRGKGLDLTAEDAAYLKTIATPVATGATKKEMKYYFHFTPKEIPVEGNGPTPQMYHPIEEQALNEVAQAVYFLAQYYIAHNQPEQAEKCYLDIAVMGWHMINERARLETVGWGIGLQEAYLLGDGRIFYGLKDLYTKQGKADRADNLKKYVEGLSDLKSWYTELENCIWSLEKLEAGNVGMYPGDIFNLVQNHPDRAVRAEATLGLGLLKYTVASPGDKAMLRKLIDRQVVSPDEIEKAAGVSAKALDDHGKHVLEGLD
jgi:hypothetical protein